MRVWKGGVCACATSCRIRQKTHSAEMVNPSGRFECAHLVCKECTDVRDALRRSHTRVPWAGLFFDAVRRWPLVHIGSTPAIGQRVPRVCSNSTGPAIPYVNQPSYSPPRVCIKNEGGLVLQSKDHNHLKPSQTSLLASLNQCFDNIIHSGIQILSKTVA